MESKREAAEKLLKLAEERAKLDDFAGAKTLALDAHELFPSLPSLHTFLIAYDVHLDAATYKLPDGRNDWHAILHVDRSADVNAIKKRGKKMCKLTHPDKNRSAAADGAFKIVKEAWNSLVSESSSQSETQPASESSSQSETPSASVQHLKAEEMCMGCGIGNYWNFCLDRHNQCLYYHCKNCNDWSPVETRPRWVNFPLACIACSCSIGRGIYYPFLHRCRNCNAESVVGAKTCWIPGLIPVPAASPFPQPRPFTPAAIPFLQPGPFQPAAIPFLQPGPFQPRVPAMVCRPYVAPSGYVMIRGCLYPWS